ncbi:MAG: TerC family protein, partial [Lactobacillus sp.]|nr:TerC family protein [Lactobacillus sp.]
MESIDFSTFHPANIPSIWLWSIFGIIVFTMLFLDLFVFHRHSTEPKVSSTLKICLSYMTIALLFGVFVIYSRGFETGMLYYTGYLVEFSLSMDNIFVISLIFTSLQIPSKYQHRVLFWGVVGAIVLRAVMILLGASLISNFHWILYIFSVFLIYTGVKMLVHKEDDAPLTESKLFKFVEKKFHVTKEIHGEHFFVKKGKKTYITPLFFALIIVELMDVIFAVDSIPAIFLITQDLFVIYTSNIFAILGLRSLYFLLAAAISRFVYLKPALAIILIFIGSKIFLPYIGLHPEAWMSLTITFGIIVAGIVISLLKT